MPRKTINIQLVEAQISISKSLEGIQENLKALNDSNILHQSESAHDRNNILDKLKVMTDKYWWLILVLIAALLVVTGYGHIIKMFI